MSPSVLESWRSLIDRIRNSVCHETGCKCRDFDKQRDFVVAVKTTAKRKYENKNVERELMRLGRSASKIDAIAQVVGIRSGTETLATNLITSAAWSLRFAVFEHGLNENINLKALVDSVVDLENRLPLITKTAEPASRTRSLQLPLQRIVARFLESYVHIIVMIEQHKACKTEILEPFFKASEAQFKAETAQYLSAQDTAQDITQAILRDSNLKPNPPDSPVLEKGSKLGKGTYGKVFVVKDRRNGEEYAEKEIESGPGESVISSPEEIREEIRIMKRLSHHHLTVLRWWIQDDNAFKLYIQPVAEKSLKDVLQIQDNPEIHQNETTYFEWFGCLAAALNYMHGCGVKHKDIKASNILIKEKQIYLSDFGASLDWSSKDSSMTKGRRVGGTPQYWAPECRPECERTEQVDAFAMGCVFAEMLASLIGLSLDQFEGWRMVRYNEKKFQSCPTIAKDLEEKRLAWRTPARSKVAAKVKFILGLVQDLLIHEPDERLSSRQLYSRFLHEQLSNERLLCGVCLRSAGH